MESKRVLVAPLDWGLGHATRCIPIIRELLKNGNEVLIAADDKCEDLLHEEFSALKFIYLKGYHLSYSSFIPAWLKIFFQVPKIIFRIILEHEQLKKIIRENKIDVVISDSRFGLWNKNVCSVYITHQLMIKCPDGFKIYEPLLHTLHERIIKKFDHCWIPDYAGAENLSGDLSHKFLLPWNGAFINPLSRFFKKESSQRFEYDVCIIISGLEPSRGVFEQIVLSQVKSFSGKAILILGKPAHKRDEIIHENVRIVSHLNSEALEKVILASKLVVCRSGYSSVMDLVALGKDAVLVPTPGQTEQEYLAQHLTSKKIFASEVQSKFNLNAMTKRDERFSVKNIFFTGDDFSQLSKIIRNLKDC